MRPVGVTMFCLTVVLGVAPVRAAEAWPEAIEDNSFFLEEAYNQEDHVVQHIGTVSAFLRPRVDFAFGFTQEWPLGGPRHQLSYTLPWLSLDTHDERGLAAILLHYRYQWLTEEDGAAVAPRLSIVLPSGDEDVDLDRTGPGAQVNLPVSRRLARDWVLHGNAGFTLLPGVRPPAGAGGERTLAIYNAGLSVIWLQRTHLNWMAETVWFRGEGFDDAGRLGWEAEVIFSPGLRAALDRRNLQVVPGAALPLRFDDGDVQAGVFVYLSFEHPFGER